MIIDPNIESDIASKIIDRAQAQPISRPSYSPARQSGCGDWRLIVAICAVVWLFAASLALVILVVSDFVTKHGLGFKFLCVLFGIIGNVIVCAAWLWTARK